MAGRRTYGREFEKNTDVDLPEFRYTYCQTVFADTITGKDGNWEYEISEEYENDGKKEYATLKKYLGSETNVIVPATIDGLKIKTLNSTFSDNTTVEFVIIPEGITELYNTFTGCTSLKHVNLPTSITMYNAAFQRSAIEEITIPKGSYEWREPLSYCDELRKVDVLGEINHLSSPFISRCPKLESVDINVISAILGGCEAIASFCDNLKVVNISAIGWGLPSFSNCINLNKVFIGRSYHISQLTFNAFSGCINLSTVTLPEKIDSINDSFCYCYKLKDIYYAGSECQWKGIDIVSDASQGDKLNQATIHFMKKSVHEFSDWTITIPATALTAGMKERTCTVCGEKQTSVIKKLTPKLKLGKTSVKLAKTKSVFLKIAFAKGDKITCKAVTIKKGKTVTLKPVVKPALTDDKLTFKSADKKIASVTAKGVVIGKKKGTTTITVKSGKKSVKVTVTVK